MHDARTDRPDLAGRAVRDALPTPDDEAVARIATLIESRAAAPEPGRTRRVAWGRRLPQRRAIITAGTVAVAATIALLAPTSDDPDRAATLLRELGPDAAAAEVLHAAGRTVTDDPWRPLSDGELHYVRSTALGGADRALRITERWVGVDGAGRTRELVDTSTIADGAAFYVPASVCVAPDPSSPASLAGITDTLAVGSTPPACWRRPGLTDPVLRAATGRTVAAPPVGAPVYLPALLAPAVDGRDLAFGDEVRETDDPPATPGGFGTGPGTDAEPGFQPYHLRAATTWIRVEPRTVEVIDVQGSPSPRSNVDPMQLSWSFVFTVDDLDELPTTAAGMAALLGKTVDAQRNPAGAGGPSAPLPAFPRQVVPRETAMVLLASELLAEAPISPEVRRATFDALATLRFDDQPARAVHDAQLTDGRPAIGVEFPHVAPSGFEHPGDEGDGTLLLLDARTGQLAERVVEVGTMRFTTTWDAPRRVPADG